jgi:signal transduction histidine kinase/ligand-binding sensor domain-containing protein
MKKYLLFTTILTSLFFGCSTKKEKKSSTVISKTLGKLITDSIAPPVVTMITAANAPKVIKAAPPTIVPLTYPYGVGVPTFTNYGIADGLLGTNVPSSAIDQQGNIWFGTFSGICKYDGSSFTNYNSGNGLSSDYTHELFIDSKNNIWIANAEGLNIFDGKYFARLPLDKDISSIINVRKILEDNKGTIWLGTQNGLYKYTNKTFTRYTTADGLSHNFIDNVLQDKNGDILISTDKGITRYDGKTFTPYLNIPANKDGRTPVLKYCDSKGNIWFNQRSNDRPAELGKYDGRQIKIYTKADGDSNTYHSLSMKAFLEDKKGNYWIGGINGLTKFDGNRFIIYATKDGLEESAGQIISLSEDAYGNIWAGTQRMGVYKISSSYLAKMEKASGGLAFAFAIDEFDNKWIIGREGLHKYYSNHIAYYGNQLLSRFASVLFIDHAGNIWFQPIDPKTQSWNLAKFDGTEFTIFGKDQGISLQFIRKIIEDDSNNIWFAGSNGGVVKFDGVSFYDYGKVLGLTSKRITFIFQDSKKNIWFGCEDGLYKYAGHRFTIYSTRDGLPHNFINYIAEDGSGNIWLGTDGGAAKFDGKTFTSYRAKDGLSNTIREVKYDSVSKSIWFATGIGLASLKMEQVNEEKPIFQHYNPRTGFNISTAFNLIIDKQGVVWGRNNGIFRFDYKSIKDSKPIPLQIKNIRLDNKNISWNSLRIGAYPVGTKDSLAAINEMGLKFGKSFSDEDFRVMENDFGKVSFDSVAGSDFIPVNLVLPIKNNSITFDFGSISTSFAKAVQYQYKLEGYDKNWSELSNKTEASFGNMSEGNYTFHVKALSPFGSWSETSYSFKVLPPWWRTWWAYTSYVLLLGIAIITFIRWRTKALQKEKIILEQKVTSRTAELNQSLENLKATQSQLIQSEKMASLGELTAGIAHEIQNPLNFVNNFSEVNKEMLEELKAERLKPNAERNDDLQNELINDVIANEEKINHHGKRADAIVKGMLQHSRSSSGQKEPTDINDLCDEYLRLAYHGLRAKDKSFNATMKTDFDNSIGNINIIPQDIGRVVLNLINNAFYACTERLALSKAEVSRSAVDEKKTLRQAQGDSYEPTVTVSTKKVNARPDDPVGRGKVEIKVADNGNGIPQKILDKIFQPFFTTKPTGQGTGLGLSLSYDIVKAHGGEIKVETKENEGTEFIIHLPTS